MKVSKIDNNLTTKNTQSFKGAGFTFATKAADLFIKSQENLSSTRFIQDTATNWFPKAIFTRSKADFAEMSFLEFLESAIFYFASPILGEKLFRNKVFNNFIPKDIRKDVNNQITSSVSDILANKSLTKEVKNSALATKAGIVLACAAIPIAEYTLSFAKNLFTLKTFKKSNFNDIANLNKKNQEGETIEHQQKVEKNAKNQLKKAGILSLAGIAAGIALALSANKKGAEGISKAILEPGKAASSALNKIGLKAPKFLENISLDFASENGKLALSKGQLGLTAIVGLFGYSKAAGDRGKLDKQEVWTRVPLVVFYTIFGSELFEKAFVKILNNKNKCQDVFKHGLDGKVSVLKRIELDEKAKELASKSGATVKEELSKLIKQKAFVSAVPYLFSLVFMGFTLSALTRLCTQRRYNKQKQAQEKLDRISYKGLFKNLPKEYKAFQTSQIAE